MLENQPSMNIENTKTLLLHQFKEETQAKPM